MGATTTARTARIAILSAAFLCAWKPPAAPAADTPTAARSTWTKLQPANGNPISEKFPVTFCVFFRPGEFAGQRPITVVADRRPVPAQVDVKRTFDDGSVKHAIVSMTYEHHRKFMESPDAHPLGIALVRQGGGKGDVTIPPWQHDFNVLVADWAARAGFVDAAKFRDRLLVFTIGRFTSAPDFSPQTGTGYWWIIARNDQQYLTWKALYDANYPQVPRGQFVTREDFQANKAYKTAGGQWDDYIGSYVSIARAATAAGVRSGFPKAREAYDFVSHRSPQILKNESSDPTWSFRLAPEFDCAGFMPLAQDIVQARRLLAQHLVARRW